MIRKISLITLLAFQLSVAFAREGMWIPILLDKNIEEMQQMGFNLTHEDIYSVNHSSLKDGIVLFGRGCTGELISPDGLLVTNHHCGIGQVQSHSSLDHDYLTDGFWAMSRQEELPNKDLEVTFLIEMKEVTQQVLKGTDSLLSENAIFLKKQENTANLEKEAVAGTHYEAKVKPFFNGNQYFLFITEKFTDVRLVGAPPSAIGRFGGDTDNWMWPRHTGDFSLFRIYADSLNQPASYSQNNVPYRPKKFFPIKMSGINEGDFTMVFGYPGTTNSYLPSEAIKQLLEQRNPDRISIRDIKLKLIANAMNESRAVRIKYAAKYASTSNAWKKWQGESMGLKRMNAISIKEKGEDEFTRWVEADVARKYEYNSVLPQFKKLYTEIATYQKAKDYFDEIVMRGADAYLLFGILKGMPLNLNESQQTAELKKLDNYFKDFDAEVDRNVFIELMKKYYDDLPVEFLPNDFRKIASHPQRDLKLAEMYHKSLLCKHEKLKSFVEKGDVKTLKRKLKNDGFYQLYSSLIADYNEKVSPHYNRLITLVDQNQKFYMAALLAMKQHEMLYPDANSTMRVSYGKVEGFAPADGVNYKYYTTLDGIIEKDNPEIYDYRVPEKLKELYNQKDYGNYANLQGELPVCFTASNHTTGGNSGSPVINADGYLIGINFDRAWEGTMSDLIFDPHKCRNISLDIRYMLFLIDKYAGAGYLLNEMEIVD